MQENDFSEENNEISEDNSWRDVVFLTILMYMFQNELKYSGFKDDVKTTNRFIPSEATNELFEQISTFVDDAIINLNQGFHVYRARIVENDLKNDIMKEYFKYLRKTINVEDYASKEDLDNSDVTTDEIKMYEFYPFFFMDRDDFVNNLYMKQRHKNQFAGYDAINSGAPKINCAKSGRLNHENIVFLYTSEKPETAMHEIRPIIKQHISLAELKTVKEMKILDLTKKFESVTDSQIYDGKLSYSSIMQVIADDFIKPNHNNQLDYLPTQYLSEYFREVLKLDGIKFYSSLHKKGVNYVFFDVNSCEVVSSKIVEVDNVEVSFLEVSTED